MMIEPLYNPDSFSRILYEKMKRVTQAIEDLELYEFRYCLDPLVPENGDWGSVEVVSTTHLEQMISRSEFFSGIQLKPRVGERIVLDANILRLTNMLFVGLVLGCYPEEWVNAHFYFDVRGFFFLVRTKYFNENVLAHFAHKPWVSFEPKQKRFAGFQSLGYKDFKEANAEVDQKFIEIVQTLIAAKGSPVLLAIAGPTAAGKTEIVDRLRSAIEQTGKQVTSIEMDNFLTDRDEREAKGIHTLGKAAIHYDLFQHSLEEILHKHKITIPRYDFVYATSSHSLDGQLKAGCTPLEIEPADIVFMEGNFPFLLQEIANLIDIKVVYLTDDAIRLKRKWKRDIDYRKKYEPTYFRNRFFKDQFLMAQKCYQPQMEVCDVLVDTTGAAIWVTPEVGSILQSHP
jgi:uridine kinase